LKLRELESIESSHFIKCLFCEDNFDCEDPKNEDTTNFLIEGIDRDLKRLLKLKYHLDYEKLKKEGE